jgi:hypothetical protein
LGVKRNKTGGRLKQVSGNFSNDKVKTNNMDKGQILKGLSEVQQELTATRIKLENLVSQSIWSKEVYPELDDSVGILQELNKKINDLMDIQRNVLMKPKK